ncbi:Rap30/74 interaction domain-containing protein [Panus rudis PR-1116 ss-1]|nr:Rap30/74 interaction domain-containing protein [Panus rudis PR-1116 ss-1]
MAPSSIESVLFPSKRKTAASGSASDPSQGANGASSPKKRPVVPRRKPKPEDDGFVQPPPEGPYQEFKLVSSRLNGWKYDVMKFDERKPVDILEWQKPIKLNRKDLRKEAPQAAAPVAVGIMKGPDGKPVTDSAGNVVQVDADGRPIRMDLNGTPSSSGSQQNDKGKEKAKKRNQKKTRQVFPLPEEIRQLRREERYPWVMEDGSGREVWVGHLEDVENSKKMVMFMPTTTNVFKLVPAHRWYKFQKKRPFQVPSLEEAEQLMSQRQKNKDPEMWLLRKRGQVSEATKSMFKAEREGSVPLAASGSLVHSVSQSLGPGGRKLRAVDSGGDLFGDDDDEDSGERKRKLKKELGAEGDVDELDFEEDFADDEEKVEGEAEDEDAKEAEERLKRQYRNANKTREGYIDESEEEEEEDPKLSLAGKDMKKLMKKLEKNLAYEDSDDEKNPYASSEESEEEEEPPQVPQGPAIIPPEPKAGSRSSSQAPSTPNPSQPALTVKTEPSSRPTSPVPMPGHGGHSVVAKRATSPKAPKLKTAGVSRASSPLAGAGSRATSPVAAGSAGGGTHPESPSAQSPGVPTKPSNKRKADDQNAAGPSNKAKKRKAVTGELDAQMLIDWLKVTPNATTRDCIHHFTPYLRGEEEKKKFAQLVKEVAVLKDGVLTLRSSVRNKGSGTPSAASPAANGE